MVMLRGRVGVVVLAMVCFGLAPLLAQPPAAPGAQPPAGPGGPPPPPKNLKVLHEQECFTHECRMIFSNLAQRWSAKADVLARQEDRPRGGFGLLQPVHAKNR